VAAFLIGNYMDDKILFKKHVLVLALSAAASIAPCAAWASAADALPANISGQAANGKELYTFFLAPQHIGYGGLDAEPPAVKVQDVTDPEDFRSWNKPEVRALVGFLEKKYGITARGMSSWTIPTFSAAVSVEELTKLQASGYFSSVEKMDSNNSLEFSQWFDSTVPGTPEAISWGKIAMGTNDSQTTTNPVYVLDGWIEANNELNVRNLGPVVRVNDNINKNYAPEHAAHVAGILGARRNAVGSVGINPGAPLVNVQRRLDAITLSDMILKDAEDRNLFATLNFSSSSGAKTFNGNGGTLGPQQATPLHKMLKRLSTRLFVVQAAGNVAADACKTAYNAGQYYWRSASNPVDGIMVVGGVDSYGQQAKPFDNLGVVMQGTTFTMTEAGSSFGPCVEAWAPATKIVSTWYGSKPIEYLSGTSMAAPHVAALAARYGNSTSTPVQREWWIRSKLVATGYNDTAGLPIKMPNFLQTPIFSVPVRLPVTRITTSGGSGDVNTMIDGKYLSGNFWNSGAQAGWVTFDLGSVRTIKGIRMTPASSPYSLSPGDATHQIEIMDTGYPKVVAVHQAAVDELEPISIRVNEPNNIGRYIRINTPYNSVSWTSWREIEIYGY
jgi:hypothetical protein